MPQARTRHSVDFHRKQAAHFARLAKERHYRAAVLARRSLAAQKQGRPVEARRLIQRALQVKAAAARAGLRSKNHRARIAEIRKARAESARCRYVS